MMACCNTETKSRSTCPACRQCCIPASWQTMLHQIRFPENQSLANDDYTFCTNRDCPAGYISASHMVPKNLLRAFDPDRPAMLCHCFDISEPGYVTALRNHTAGAIRDFVVRQTRAGLCACEIRSPDGRCCLARFRELEKAHAD